MDSIRNIPDILIRTLIDNKDFKGIEQALTENPELANEGIPYDEQNTTKAHPLHRISDAVFTGKLNEVEAIELAKIFLKHGAKINGNEQIEKKDTPLIAAASLHADGLAFFYIDNGADIHHAGTHGGTALHWAAWCGRNKLVKRLIEEGAEINKTCIDFKSTPLFWAVHGLKKGDKNDLQDHLESVKLLIEAKGDKTIPNAEGKTVFDLTEEEDRELKQLLDEI